MNKINWTIVAIVAVALLFVASLFGGRGYGWEMMGSGMMGGWGFSPFGWIGMTVMWLIPIGTHRIRHCMACASDWEWKPIWPARSSLPFLWARRSR